MAEVFEITGAGELQALAGRLAKVPAAERLLLRRNLRAVAIPMQNAVRANVLAIPTHGDKSTGLRRSIARATKIRTSVTAKGFALRVWVDPKAMPPGQEKLPALMESPGWKHEVFGNPVYVFQEGHSYFQQPAEVAKPAAFAAAEAAIVEATRTV